MLLCLSIFCCQSETQAFCYEEHYRCQSFTSFLSLIYCHCHNSETQLSLPSSVALFLLDWCQNVTNFFVYIYICFIRLMSKFEQICPWGKKLCNLHYLTTFLAICTVPAGVSQTGCFHFTSVVIPIISLAIAVFTLWFELKLCVARWKNVLVLLQFCEVRINDARSN